MKTKKNRLDSSNFFVTLITLILLPLMANGLDLPLPADEVADQLVTAVSAGDIGAIIAVVLPNIINPVMYWINNAWSGWSWGFLKSVNFWTQALTAILILLTGFGLMFPEGAAANLIDSLFGGEITAIILALVVNIINPFIHFFKGKKAEA